MKLENGLALLVVLAISLAGILLIAAIIDNGLFPLFEEVSVGVVLLFIIVFVLMKLNVIKQSKKPQHK